jgi:hypothetical protein
MARGVLCLDSVAVHVMNRNEGPEARVTKDALVEFKYRLRNEGSHYWHAHGKVS